MATAEKRVVTDATGQAMLAELRKIPGVMNPVPVEKGGTGVTTPEGIRELINAQEKLNFDVEEELNKRAKSVNGILPDELGNIQVLHVAEADNFSSDEAQTISGTFIERTTGGDASIHDGTANLTALYGYSVRSGYSEETKSFQVIPTGRLDDSEPISAEINWSTYKTAVNNVSTNKTFTYGVSGWNENPETYGITVSGTPATGDVMNVYFTAEVRGTIANTTPQTFVETGWNLYNHTNGYARVLKYSEDYGFMIGGTYTGIAFAETVEGAQTVLTPDSNGIFTIPSDGYVFVTGGNDTDTFILMTWSDWGEGYTGEFETYSESVVDLSELMSNAFPYGMCNIGIVYDEINFNDKTAYVRIERQAYTAENLINAEATGRAFTYDADYIYIVKETPEKIRFNIDSEVTVYDHGTEYFTGTDLPVLTYQLFGQNLKDKLRREVVAVTPQNFSVAQKAIARQNIDAAFDQEVIKTINHKTPDQYGDITIVEGTANASYGLYRINATIQPAAWSLVNGAYQIAYADPLIKSDMDGMETWLDNPEAMKGKTRFTTIDGALIISTAVQPTETWSLHVALGTNGATVLEQVYNKAEENTVALVEHDDTAFHAISEGQYVLWKGTLYKATADIAVGATLVSSGNNANLSALSKGVANDIANTMVEYINTVSPDFNTLKKAGMYGVQGAPTNGPNTKYSCSQFGHLLVIEYRRSYSNYFVQEFFSHDNPSRCFIRRTVDAQQNWSDWYEVITDGTVTVNGKKSFSGTLEVRQTGTNQSINFTSSNLAETNAQIWTVNNGNGNKYASPFFVFREFSPSSNGNSRTGFYEDYQLPTVDVGLAQNKGYKILTSKAAVAIGEGGTGGRTALEALANLGIGLQKTSPVVDFDTTEVFIQYVNYANSTGTKPTGTNNAALSNGYLITYVRESNLTAMQFYKASASSDYNLYMRLMAGGTWQTWHKITFT